VQFGPNEPSPLDQEVTLASNLTPYGRRDVSLGSFAGFDCPRWAILMFQEIEPNFRPATTGTNEYGCPKSAILANEVYRPIIHALRLFRHTGDSVNRRKWSADETPQFPKHG
jgi:hypothetical protein